MPVPRLAVLGAGVSGLALAVRYAQYGGVVDLYEKRSTIPVDGFAFILQENGLAALDRLGLRDDVMAAGRRLTEYQLTDHEGNELTTEQLGNCVGLRRGDLVHALLARLPAGVLHFGKSFVRFGGFVRGRAATAWCADGTEIAADMFAGADGIGSAVRSRLFPGHGLAPVRVKEVVSCAPAAALGHDRSTRFSKIVHRGGGLAVGYVPCGDDLVWFLQFDAQRYPCDDRDAARVEDFIRRTLAGWPPVVRRLIEATDFARSHVWYSTRLATPLPHYLRGNVVLLGDAAHPLPSLTSQGVNSALEDAVALADALALAGPVALADYSTTRAACIAGYLSQGAALEADFLDPVGGDPAIPLAR
ncbi:MAG TPA: FAD-dependent monooxygenase [Pilimelia sp.]|nr:FAD-dependent monooxygenase [Pilimelia sp.]